MQFSQSTYSQSENTGPLVVSLVLEPFGGTGTGSASITQNVVANITASVQAGDTAVGKELIMKEALNCIDEIV